MRYAECDTRPVAVGACGCGCEDDECEYTRIRDSFELRLLDEMPHGELVPPIGPGPSTSGSLIAASSSAERRSARSADSARSPALARRARRRPDLHRGGRAHVRRARRRRGSCSPSVTLASSGDVDIVGDPYRRYVASFGAYSFRCKGQRPRTIVDAPGAEAASALIDLAQRDEAAPATATVAARTSTGAG